MVRSLQGANAGEICPESRSHRTRRRWWYNRWAVTLDQLNEGELEKLDEEVAAYLRGDDVEQEENEADPTPPPAEDPVVENDLEDGEASDDETVEDGDETVTAVSAEEGKQGWWEVTFSDGTKQKMRRTEVLELGLLEPEDDV